MEGQIPQYPRLSADAVKFANRLNRRGSGSLAFTSDGQSYLLRPDSSARCSEFSASVQCNINGHRLQVGLNSGLCGLLLSDWLSLEEIAALPNDLKQSVIAAAFEPIRDFFVKHSAGNFSVENIECQPARPSQSSLFFNLSSINGVAAGYAFVDIGAQTADILGEVWQAVTESAPPTDTANLPIPVEVIIGNADLNLDEFRRLGEGDVVLLDVAFSETKEVYVRIGGNICFSSLIEGSNLIIQKRGGATMASDEQPSVDLEAEDQEAEIQTTDNQETDTLDAEQKSSSDDLPFAEEPPSEVSLNESTLSEPPLNESPSSAGPDNQDDRQDTIQPNDLSDLPIRLLFIVDQFNAALKEIEQVKPGYVFELNKKPVGKVEIRANGTPIGSGELVQIEDRAGVRVLELYGQKETDE